MERTKNLPVSERSQPAMVLYCMIPFIGYSGKWETGEKVNRLVATNSLLGKGLNRTSVADSFKGIQTMVYNT